MKKMKMVVRNSWRFSSYFTSQETATVEVEEGEEEEEEEEEEEVEEEEK